MKFNLTYDIVTRESAENGDFAYNGFITRNGETVKKRNYIPKNPAQFSLRESIEVLERYHSGSEPIESDSYPIDESIRWITVSNFDRSYPDETTRVSLHFPDNLSGASRLRIYKLLNS